MQTHANTYTPTVNFRHKPAKNMFARDNTHTQYANLATILLVQMTLSLPHTLTRSHTLTHAHPCSHTLTHAHTRSHTLTHAHTCSLTLSFSHTHSQRTRAKRHLVSRTTGQTICPNCRLSQAAANHWAKFRLKDQLTNLHPLIISSSTAEGQFALFRNNQTWLCENQACEFMRLAGQVCKWWFVKV